MSARSCNIDTALPQEELNALRDSIQQSLSIMPHEALVGLITFGTMVQVHELGFAECPKAYVFKGSKEVSADTIHNMLGLRAAAMMASSSNVPGAPGASNANQQVPGTLPPGANRFLMPVSECTLAMDSILDNLTKDPWPCPKDQRRARCTGVALSVAVGMLEKMCNRRGARIMLFTGGPPTIGPGAIVDRSFAITIRSHNDLQKGKATLFKDAQKHYLNLAQRCVQSCHIVDIFACSLDQFGLLEMKSCVELTGGVAVLCDFFTQSIFKESFRRIFTRYPSDASSSDAGYLATGFAGTLECITTKEYKVCGAIGPCSSLQKKGPYVSENEVGQGGTCSWRMCCLDPNATIAFYFEIVNQEARSIPPQKRRHLQLITHYQHSNGRIRIRVTTVGGPWQSDPNNLSCIVRSFDQEAATVLTVRVAVQRTEQGEVNDIIRWLDRSLIQLCSKFGEYRPSDATSFRLPAEFTLYPQFMFHLRRSEFLQVFNSSPDEAAFHRITLARETTMNSLIMIQPTLISYSISRPPSPVLLDITSVKPDTILLLDSYFVVIISHGDTIAAWRDAGYQNNADYANFANLLQAPKDDAQMIIDGRMQVPRYIVCDSRSEAQFRFIKTKLIPPDPSRKEEITHNLFTDDASLSTFIEHLISHAVKSE